jgi:hypothetical protein
LNAEARRFFFCVHKVRRAGHRFCTHGRNSGLSIFSCVRFWHACHYDHILDVPHIALKTRAAVIGTESTENVMRAYAIPEQQLITVRGGEDYQFSSFSLKVIPSIHSPLDHKHYFSSATAPAGMKHR